MTNVSPKEMGAVETPAGDRQHLPSFFSYQDAGTKCPTHSFTHCRGSPHGIPTGFQVPGVMIRQFLSSELVVGDGQIRASKAVLDMLL